MSACSGLIAGMGETDEQLVEVVLALREIGADSVPVNFLMPFDGTPLQGVHRLTPLRCLAILAMVRFIHPDAEVRVAGGREDNLRSLQPVALEVANSIFLGDYLTSEGQSGAADLAMIADAGFVPLRDHACGEGDAPMPDAEHAPTSGAEHAPTSGAGRGGGAGNGTRDEAPAIRRRGAGTDRTPNA